MDLMIDCETMGIDPTVCAVVNFAFLPFNFSRFVERPYTFDELLGSVTSFKLNVRQQVDDHGYKVDPDTLAFWRSLPPEVRKQATPTAHDLSLSEFGDSLFEWRSGFAEFERVWARGMNFDPVILRRLLRDCNRDLDDLISYNGLRDTRTYLDTCFFFQLKTTSFPPIEDTTGEEEFRSKYLEHNSAHDCVVEVLRMQMTERAR